MSVSTRLTVIAPDLVELGKSLSSEKRQAVARRVAGWACEIADVASYLGNDRLGQLLRNGGAYSDEERSLLERDIEALDGKFFDTQGDDSEPQSSSVSLMWFAKARALSSLLYSLEPRSVEAFCDALYEAQAATDDLEGLRQACR